jgi:hypothetical protein
MNRFNTLHGGVSTNADERENGVVVSDMRILKDHQFAITLTDIGDHTVERFPLGSMDIQRGDTLFAYANCISQNDYVSSNGIESERIPYGHRVFSCFNGAPKGKHFLFKSCKIAYNSVSMEGCTEETRIPIVLSGQITVSINATSNSKFTIDEILCCVPPDFFDDGFENYSTKKLYGGTEMSPFDKGTTGTKLESNSIKGRHVSLRELACRAFSCSIEYLPVTISSSILKMTNQKILKTVTLNKSLVNNEQKRDVCDSVLSKIYHTQVLPSSSNYSGKIKELINSNSEHLVKTSGRSNQFLNSYKQSSDIPEDVVDVPLLRALYLLGTKEDVQKRIDITRKMSPDKQYLEFRKIVLGNFFTLLQRMDSGDLSIELGTSHIMNLVHFLIGRLFQQRPLCRSPKVDDVQQTEFQVCETSLAHYVYNGIPHWQMTSFLFDTATMMNSLAQRKCSHYCGVFALGIIRSERIDDRLEIDVM